MHLLIAATAGDCNSLQTPCRDWEVKDEFQGSGISMMSAGSVHDSRATEAMGKGPKDQIKAEGGGSSGNCNGGL